MTGDWARGQLGTIGGVVATGPFGSLLHKSDYVTGGTPLINPANIVGDKIVADANKGVDGAALRRLAAYRLATNDIIIGRRGEIGRCAVVTEAESGWLCGTGCFFIRPMKNVLPEFLANLLRSPVYRACLEKAATGATMLNLSNSSLAEMLIALPPVPEQRRIVAILDETFAGVDAAVANAEKNLAHTRELFESYLNSVFNQRGEGWDETTLGDIAEFKNGLNYSRQSRGQSVPIVGVANFQNHFSIEANALERVQIDGVLDPSYELREGDILTVRSNGNRALIGRCLLVLDVAEPTSYSGFTIRIRLADKRVRPDLLAWQLKTSRLNDLMVAGGGGANISSLNQTILASLPILIPSGHEQRDLVSTLHRVRQETTRLEENVAAKVSQLKDLRQSILHKAFTGELTAKPERAMREATA